MSPQFGPLVIIPYRDPQQAIHLFELESEANDSWTIEHYAHQITHGLTLVAYSGATRIGYIAAVPVQDEVEILKLFVLEAFRRNGVAKVLMEEVIKQSRARHYFLEVRRNNFPAQALYQKMGFVRLGMRPRYYRDGEDALLYRLDFSSSQGII